MPIQQAGIVMPTRFWFDERGAKVAANGVPESAVEGLLGDMDGEAKGTLLEGYHPRIPENVPIRPRFALYMSGTIDELRTSLISAMAGGMRNFEVRGRPAVWYIQREHLGSTEAIVCIAGRSAGFDHYWRIRNEQHPAQSELPASLWKELPSIGPGRETITSLPIEDVVNALKLVEGEKAWYPKFPDSIQFSYHNLRRSQQSGKFFKQYYIEDFYVVQARDAVSSSDQSKWTYTGDKVHVSVEADRVKEAWNLILPLLVERHDTIGEFKVTDMAQVKKSLGGDKANRIYYGAQITINLHASPGDSDGAARRFAKVLKEASAMLESAGIGEGMMPVSDLPIRKNRYVSFRRDYNDLISPSQAEARKQYAREMDVDEQYYMVCRFPAEFGKAYIGDSDPSYPKHRELMKDRRLYKVLLDIL